MVQDTFEFHELRRRDAVGWLTMDRPAAHNAMTTAMADELRQATATLADDASIRVIVLTGRDDVFNTGADLSAFEGDESDEKRLWGVARRLHAAIEQLVYAQKPVICAVNGVAAGGGFGLALSGDLVYVRADARLEFAYPRIGLSGDGGASYLLPALAGMRTAREIALLDEPIDAERAVDLGLATDVVTVDAFDETIETVATDLASGPTKAYGRFKRLLIESHERPFRDQLRFEEEVISRLARTDDYAAGHRAFMEKSSADFTGE